MRNVQLTDAEVLLLETLIDTSDPEDVLEDGFSDQEYDDTIDLMRSIMRKLV